VSGAGTTAVALVQMAMPSGAPATVLLLVPEAVDQATFGVAVTAYGCAARRRSPARDCSAVLAHHAHAAARGPRESAAGLSPTRA